MKPLVSILIPAFNAERSIASTLESAVGQSWSAKEIVVVDDGSTDRTAEIVQRFADRGVRLVSQENQGAAAARNRAFAESRGSVIQWLDADDLLSVDKIALQMEALARVGNPESTAMSCPWGQFLSRPHKARFVPTALWTDLSARDWTCCKLENNLYMQTATWLVGRRATEAAGEWNTELLGDDDGEFFARMLLQVNQVKFVPEAKVYYRMPGAGNLSHIGTSSRKMDAQFRSMQLTIAHARSLDDGPGMRHACTVYLQNWLSNFHPERPDIIEALTTAGTNLGRKPNMPRMSWKYTWLAAIIGALPAKRVQATARSLRWSLARALDEGAGRLAGSSGPL